jgi:ectoine hydroxylase-related dioxygenase (phytanoyl-CoA dioxygenase family)
LAAFWIPLEDIHTDSGPLVYYRGSHDVSKVGFFDWGSGYINNFDRFNSKEQVSSYAKFLELKVKDMNFKPLYFLPKKGDLLIWHGALIHGGSPIKNRNLTRKSFVGHFTSLDSHYALTPHFKGGGFVLDAPAVSDIRAFSTEQSGAAPRSYGLLKQAYWRFRKAVAGR